MWKHLTFNLYEKYYGIPLNVLNEWKRNVMTRHNNANILFFFLIHTQKIPNFFLTDFKCIDMPPSNNQKELKTVADFCESIIFVQTQTHDFLISFFFSLGSLSFLVIDDVNATQNCNNIFAEQ